MCFRVSCWLLNSGVINGKRCIQAADMFVLGFAVKIKRARGGGLRDACWVCLDRDVGV